MLEYNPEAPPEYTDIKTFAEYVCDDERDYTPEELHELAYWLKASWMDLKNILADDWDLKCSGQKHEHKVRTFQTSSNDRWFGPGSSPTCGGSGWEQIAGFAGQVG